MAFFMIESLTNSKKPCFHCLNAHVSCSNPFGILHLLCFWDAHGLACLLGSKGHCRGFLQRYSVVIDDAHAGGQSAVSTDENQRRFCSALQPAVHAPLPSHRLP